jgi:hypothetical protein
VVESFITLALGELELLQLWLSQDRDLLRQDLHFHLGQKLNPAVGKLYIAFPFGKGSLFALIAGDIEVSFLVSNFG